MTQPKGAPTIAPWQASSTNPDFTPTDLVQLMSVSGVDLTAWLDAVTTDPTLVLDPASPSPVPLPIVLISVDGPLRPEKTNGE